MNRLVLKWSQLVTILTEKKSLARGIELYFHIGNSASDSAATATVFIWLDNQTQAAKVVMKGTTEVLAMSL